MKDFSYEILDLLEKYKNDTAAALEGETCPQCLYAFSPLRALLSRIISFVEVPIYFAALPYPGV